MSLPERMRDAAFPESIQGNWAGAVGGYYGGPRALNAWSPGNWQRFSHLRKLPIWVAGTHGPNEGKAAVAILRSLGVPKGAWTALDMETRVNRLYVRNFADELHAADYQVWVYGSASTVFGNPAIDGYWVADYAGKGPFMYDAGPDTEVRATQYASGDNWDSSTVKDYTWNKTTWWI